MEKFYKVICTAVSLSLMFGGCDYSRKKILQPNIQPKKVAVQPYYDEITQLAERVVKLSKDFFPYGSGVIYLGKSQKGADRYTVIDILKENEVEALDITLYIGSDLELEAKINEYLLNHDYESVAEALSKSSLSMTQFRDSGLNGLRTTKDLLKMRDKEGEYTATSANQFDLLEANDTYRALLKLVLEEELKMKEKG